MSRTLTKSCITQTISKEVGLSNKQAQVLLNETLSEISHSITKNKALKLSSFGSFVVLDKNDRIGRNPRTGEEVTIEQRKAISFRASNYLKSKVGA